MSLKSLRSILNSGKKYAKSSLLAGLIAASPIIGCSDKPVEENEQIINKEPIAVINANPKTGEAPLSVEFDGSQSYDTDGHIVEYAWDFDNDGNYDKIGIENKVDYKYTDPKNYNASLRVKDNQGAFGYAQTQIEVTKPVQISVDFFDNKNIRWISYAPTNFNPEIHNFPSEQSIRKDLELLLNHNFKGIITYGSDGTLGDVPRIAKDVGLSYAIMGIWSLENLEEWENALDAANYVDGYCVGSEGLNSGRYTIEELKTKIKSLRKQTKKPVTTTEVISDYNAGLLELGDWVFPNCHAYWEGINDSEDAASWTLQQYKDISEKTDKIVVLKEVGLPSAGNIGLSEEVQNSYYRTLEDLMDENSKVSFSYFEAFDQEWKDWAEVEPHWGLFDKNRNEKKVSQPQILYTFVPPRGSFLNLQGRAVNVIPEDYMTSTYILVGSTWWMKPYWAWPLTRIREDGKWTTDITTGGIDHTALKIASFLVVPDYIPVKHVLPDLNDEKVLAGVSIER